MALTKSYGPAVFCSPFFVGAIIGLFDVKRPWRTSFQVILVAILLSIAFLREGVICCLFALPIVLPMTVLGVTTTGVLRRYVRGRRALALFRGGLLLLGIAWQAVEGALDRPEEHPVHVARSAIVVEAPPERVFAVLTERPLEVPSRWPWFIRVGLPMPERLIVEAPARGGRVTAAFSSGVARGHVTEWVPGRSLAYGIDRYEVDDLPFHITRLGRGPNYGLRAERVEDWLTLLGTRWALAPLPDGRTALSREIVWRRHLAPAVYFAWLQQTIMQRGQDRLLELVRERARLAPVGPTPLVATEAAP
jgi:hypothetical protein